MCRPATHWSPSECYSVPCPICAAPDAIAACRLDVRACDDCATACETCGRRWTAKLQGEGERYCSIPCWGAALGDAGMGEAQFVVIVGDRAGTYSEQECATIEVATAVAQRQLARWGAEKAVDVIPVGEPRRWSDHESEILGEAGL